MLQQKLLIMNISLTYTVLEIDILLIRRACCNIGTFVLAGNITDSMSKREMRKGAIF